jgi:hypothetical protein
MAEMGVADGRRRDWLDISIIQCRLIFEMRMIAFVLVAMPLLVLADGIPFDRDKGRVMVPHETFLLSEAQRLELIFGRKVTLTAVQHQRMLKRCATFPLTIGEILSYRRGDCTCLCGHPYAILLPGCSSIAVPHSEADWVNQYGVRAAYRPEPIPGKAQSGWRRFWVRLGGGGSE